MARNNFKLSCNLIFVVSVFTINSGNSYTIQNEMVYVKQVSVSDEEDHPQKLVLSLHRDEMSDPIFEVLLEKYPDVLQEMVNSEAKSTENRKNKLRVLYQDTKKQSVVQVQRVSENQFHLQGKLCLDGNAIAIAPIDKSSPVAGHYFSLETNDDSECSNTESAENNELEHVKKEPLIFKLSNAFGKYSRETKSKDRVKREIEYLTIDLLMVIDFAAYSWWKNMVGKPDSPESEIMETIRQYYAYVFKGIDERFHGIQNQPFVVDLAFSGLFVAKSEIESYWTTQSIIDGDGESMRVMVNSSEALDKFQKWLDESDSLPSYDHAILFTGTNLTYAGSPGNTGLAFASSMCRNISNSSIVEDIFDFRTVTYATQQVARALGTRDDMDNNDCLEFFNYMMVPKFKLPIKSFGSNKWKFSQCSEQYMNDYIAELNDDGLMCLKESSLDERYPPELMELITDLPGVTYSARQQCENAFGLGSDVCRKEIKTEYSNICGGLLCTLPWSESCKLILPADGTPCGNKKYCLEGGCIEHNDAPESSDTCAFGNEPNMGCYNLVVSEPSQCYLDDIKHRCCQTCELFYTGIKGCEYGDRSDDCILAECATGDQDYAPKTCCLTCFEGSTPFPRPLLSTIPEIPMTSTKITERISTTSNPTISPVSDLSSPISTSTYFEQASSIFPSLLTSTAAQSTPAATQSTSTAAQSSSTAAQSTTAAAQSTSTVAQSSTSDNSSPSTSFFLPSPEASTAVPSLDNHQINADIRATDNNKNIHLIEKMSRSSVSPATTYPEYQDIFTETYSPFTQFDFDNSVITQSSDINGDIRTPELPERKKSSSDAMAHVEDVSSDIPLQPFITSRTASKTTQNYISDETSTRTNDISESVAKSAVYKEKCTIKPICNCIVKVSPVSSAVPVSNASSSKQTSLDTSDRTKCTYTHQKDINQSMTDRIFFKNLARSMQKSQRRITNGLYRNIKALYTTVSGHLKGFHHEYENENESGREGNEILSNDDDDMNRKLKPVWKKHYNDIVSNLKRDVRNMRYRVLALLNRHLKDG